MARRISRDPAQLAIELGVRPPEDALAPPPDSGPPSIDPGRRGQRSGSGRRVLPSGIPQDDQRLILGFLTDRHDLRPSSREAYQSDLLHLAHDLQPHGLRNAGEADLRSWLHRHTRDEALQDDPRPWSVRTARRKLAAVSEFRRWMMRRGLIEPIDHVSVLRPPMVEAPQHVAPTRDEVRSVFAEIERQVAAATRARIRDLLILDLLTFRLCYHLGLRISEAGSLRFSQVRCVGSEVEVLVEGKGGVIRPYPITGRVREAWDLWMAIRGRVAAKQGHDDFVLVHPWFRKRVSRKRAWIRLRMHAENAGLDPTRYWPHVLRHAIAQHMRERGLDLPDVQAALGHASPDGTLGYLCEISSEKRRLQVLREASAE